MVTAALLDTLISQIMTATSRALQCLELRHLICEQIASDKRSLYRLSQTCKDFMEPALDELWYHVDFSPLVLCMPRDLYAVHVESLEMTGEDIVTLVSNSFSAILWFNFTSAIVVSKVNATERLEQLRCSSSARPSPQLAHVLERG